MSELSRYLRDPTWRDLIEAEFSEEYFAEVEAEIKQRREAGVEIYPSEASVFAAFNLTPLERVKVVILGQDPYHGAGQAMGLSFSVPEGVKVPPSLRNMRKEIEADIGACALTSGDLTGWAEQGVLLLNTALTVEDGKAGSHSKIGWSQFTDRAIEGLSEAREGVVFMLWGGHAQKKASLIDAGKHLVLAGPHPSPLSAYRGFFGCKHFSKANQHLKAQGKSEIKW